MSTNTTPDGAPECVKCLHNNVSAKGSCREIITIPDSVRVGVCTCKCVFTSSTESEKCELYGTKGNEGCRTHRYAPCPSLDPVPHPLDVSAETGSETGELQRAIAKRNWSLIEHGHQDMSAAEVGAFEAGWEACARVSPVADATIEEARSFIARDGSVAIDRKYAQEMVARLLALLGKGDER